MSVWIWRWPIENIFYNTNGWGYWVILTILISELFYVLWIIEENNNNYKKEKWYNIKMYAYFLGAVSSILILTLLIVWLAIVLLGLLIVFNYVIHKSLSKRKTKKKVKRK